MNANGSKVPPIAYRVSWNYGNIGKNDFKTYKYIVFFFYYSIQFPVVLVLHTN